MKKLPLCFLLGLILSACLQASEFRLLTIGNSFSICLRKNLPQIIHAQSPHRLIFTSAYIGGCSLEKHWNCLLQAEKNPSSAPYGIGIWDSRNPDRATLSRKGNVLELLKKNQYDIITIQQASHFSWNPKTYQPYADQLIRVIRKYQPKAKILIQQTWSYRKDDPRIGGSQPKWGFNQQGMYDRLTAAYLKLARKHHLQIIPAGKAVQIYRNSKTSSAVKNLPEDVVGLNDRDRIHLNAHGEYLQACVWAAFIYGKEILDSRNFYNHPKFIPEACAFLRHCAAEAVSTPLK